MEEEMYAVSVTHLALGKTVIYICMIPHMQVHESLQCSTNMLLPGTA